MNRVADQLIKVHNFYVNEVLVGGSENEFETPAPSYTMPQSDVEPNMEETSKQHEAFIISQEGDMRIAYPIEMLPLLKTALAHLIYIQKANIDVNDFKEFNPNVERINHFSQVVESVRDLSFQSFQFVSFCPGNSPMTNGLIKIPLFKMITSKVLRDLLLLFINELAPVDVGINEMIFSRSSHKKDPTRGLGVLYFVLLDVYLDSVDAYFSSEVREKGVKFEWARSLNVCIFGFLDSKESRRFKKEFPLSELLPAWGLSAKVRTGTRGGRVLRPFNGKLFLSNDGKLNWIRPECVVDVNI